MYYHLAIKFKLPVIYHNTQQIYSHNYGYFAFYVTLKNWHFLNVCRHTNVQGPTVDGAKVNNRQLINTKDYIKSMRN